MHRARYRAFAQVLGSLTETIAGLAPLAKAPEYTQRHDASDVLHFSDASFARIARFITDTLGIQMPRCKLEMVRGRLQRRARALQIPSIDRYCQWLLDSPEGEHELDEFVSAVTTNTTKFFREADHFHWLGQTFARSWVQKNRGQSLRVWCAASSTGEEPYSLAMTLQPFVETVAGFDFSIHATDISSRVLQIARKAIYEGDAIESIPIPLRQRYLRGGTGHFTGTFRIDAELRNKVSFAIQNLMADTYDMRAPVDIIFVRNVLIYFSRATQEAVINRLCQHLRPGGHIVISHVESLVGMQVPLVAVAPAVFRFKPPVSAAGDP